MWDNFHKMLFPLQSRLPSLSKYRSCSGLTPQLTSVPGAKVEISADCMERSRLPSFKSTS